MQDACGRTAVVVGQGTSAAAADRTGLGWESASDGINVRPVVAIMSKIIIAVTEATDKSAVPAVMC